MWLHEVPSSAHGPWSPYKWISQLRTDLAISDATGTRGAGIQHFHALERIKALRLIKSKCSHQLTLHSESVSKVMKLGLICGRAA